MRINTQINGGHSSISEAIIWLRRDEQANWTFVPDRHTLADWIWPNSLSAYFSNITTQIAILLFVWHFVTKYILVSNIRRSPTGLILHCIRWAASKPWHKRYLRRFFWGKCACTYQFYFYKYPIYLASDNCASKFETLT